MCLIQMEYHYEDYASFEMGARAFQLILHEKCIRNKSYDGINPFAKRPTNNLLENVLWIPHNVKHSNDFANLLKEEFD